MLYGIVPDQIHTVNRFVYMLQDPVYTYESTYTEIACNAEYFPFFPLVFFILF